MTTRDRGFSLLELMVAMSIMMIIAGVGVTALLKLSTTQSTIWNRTQMHSGIRGATEVLQQEVGQAGRVSLPANVTLTAPVAANSSAVGSVTVSSTTGMFVNEYLTIDAGCADTASPCTSNQESVQLTAINTSSNTISGIFTKAHANGAAVQALGGFYEGIVPTSTTNGSTASVLKLFGDINGDGNMVYIEYSVQPSCICSGTCSPSTMTGNLYRNSMAYNASSKTSATASQILLANVTANPNNAACFTYTTNAATLTLPSTVTRTFVTDVAVTLTVQTQLFDAVTKRYQTETKALLNVSPRNVFNTWQLASFNYFARVQPTPSSVTALFAGPP
jgi:prepilin-type N-terminal cleavage/methylation domain-containing protein